MPYPANFHNQQEAKESALPDASLSVPSKPTNITKTIPKEITVIIEEAKNPLWVSVSEAAKLGGIQSKTIRRAIEGKKIIFKVKDNRYSIELGSVFKWLLASPKSKKKFLETGIIQYFKK